MHVLRVRSNCYLSFLVYVYSYAITAFVQRISLLLETTVYRRSTIYFLVVIVYLGVYNVIVNCDIIS